ncbi:hypothetical protein [Salinicoccus roseus]|uniref:Uncharacterized protein n=1 Tax=Salinicoccus roseus TaxID=45670 RepID=A0A265E6B2_9STAP|nr:hypothetical protein [Salinicoccus roseus]OZT77131.1 hypothetical protein CFN03_08630 [Salinicoccus roseus]
MKAQSIEQIKDILTSSNYDNHILVFSGGKLTVQELSPYGKVEITSHDNKAKQITVTENHRL